MVKSVAIICETAPIGRNNCIEAIRMATGISIMNDLEDIFVIFMGDAVYFLNTNLDPSAVNMEELTSIYRMMELSGIKIYALDKSLKRAGLSKTDLLTFENIKVVGSKEIAELLLTVDVTYKF
jgi:sulfur relay (sulfurtransferase) DsrF/TusC family protein